MAPDPFRLQLGDQPSWTQPALNPDPDPGPSPTPVRARGPVRRARAAPRARRRLTPCRGGVLAACFLAMPLGAALGMGPGAALAAVTTWQTAFLAAGAPGLLLALLALALPEPVRGASEGVDPARLRFHERVGPSREDYI